MRTIPNGVIQQLLRSLPLILSKVDEAELRKNLRLINAVRLTKKALVKLNKIENEQSGGSRE